MFALLLAAALVMQSEQEVVVLCFTQNNCGPCVQQKPAWRAAAARTGVRMVEGNVSGQPGAIAAWGITTTPTTIVVVVPKGANPTKANARIVAKAARVLSEDQIIRAVRAAGVPDGS